MKFSNTLPQSDFEIKTIEAKDLISILPSTIDYPLNVWISGRMARDGKSSENLIFLLDLDSEVPNLIKQYFDSLVKPLGIQATASHAWRNQSVSAIRLYNQGKLIVNPNLSFKEFPSPVNQRQEITLEWLCEKLPKEIDYLNPIYLTGSLVKFGYSFNDVDLMVDKDSGKHVHSRLRKYFTDLLGVKVDVGEDIMIDREPIYSFKIYDHGKLCLS